MRLQTLLIVKLLAVFFLTAVYCKEIKKLYNGLQQKTDYNHTADCQPGLNRCNSTNHNLDSKRLENEHNKVSLDDLHQALLANESIIDQVRQAGLPKDDSLGPIDDDDDLGLVMDNDYDEMDPKIGTFNDLSGPNKIEIQLISGGIQKNLMGATVQTFAGGFIYSLEEGDTIINFVGGVIRKISGGKILNIYGGTIGLPASMKNSGLDLFFGLDGPIVITDEDEEDLPPPPSVKRAQNDLEGINKRRKCGLAGCRS